MFFNVKPRREYSLYNFFARGAIWNILDYDLNTRDRNFPRFAPHSSNALVEGKSHVCPFPFGEECTPSRVVRQHNVL